MRARRRDVSGMPVARGSHREPPGRRPAAEDGSGTLLAVALVGAMLVFTGVFLPLLGMLAAGHSVRGAADAAALAAADTASGAVAGVPCDRAAETARLNDAVLVDCDLEGLVASVSVRRSVGVLDVRSRARAGPPGNSAGDARAPPADQWKTASR